MSALNLVPLPNTPLGQEFEEGNFKIPDTLDMISELRELVKQTELSRGSFRSVLKTLDQALNSNINLKPEW